MFALRAKFSIRCRHCAARANARGSFGTGIPILWSWPNFVHDPILWALTLCWTGLCFNLWLFRPSKLSPIVFWRHKEAHSRYSAGRELSGDWNDANHESVLWVQCGIILIALQAPEIAALRFRNLHDQRERISTNHFTGTAVNLKYPDSLSKVLSPKKNGFRFLTISFSHSKVS